MHTTEHRNGLSLVLVATERSMQLCGLWPFHFDRRSQLFRRSIPLTIYSWFVLPSVVLMLFLTARNYRIPPTLQLGRIDGNLYVIFWSLLMLATEASMYIALHWHGDRIARLLIGVGRLHADIVRHSDQMDMSHDFGGGGDAESIGPSLAQYAVKSLLLCALDLGTTVYHIASVTPAMLGDRQAMFAALLSALLVSAVPHSVYGVLLALRHSYRLLNGRLNVLVGTLRHKVISRGSATNRHRSAHRRMHACCVLSDRLDELAAQHRRLTKLAQRLNATVAWPLLMWTMFGMESLVGKLFVQYIEIAMALSGTGGRSLRLLEFLLNIVSVLTTFGHMAALANVCVATVNEVIGYGWRSCLLRNDTFLSDQF